MSDPAEGNDSADRRPPVPAWKPAFAPDNELLVERVSYYTDGRTDFAQFRHGTIALLPSGLTDDEAQAAAVDILDRILNAHPDMNPLSMDDGNIVVQYNHPALNVVLTDFAAQHWAEIDARHLSALAEHEVLITPLGSNVFDDFGKKALFGRCFMFMDALDPHVIRIVRANPDDFSGH